MTIDALAAEVFVGVVTAFICFCANNVWDSLF